MFIGIVRYTGRSCCSWLPHFGLRFGCRCRWRRRRFCFSEKSINSTLIRHCIGRSCYCFLLFLWWYIWNDHSTWAAFSTVSRRKRIFTLTRRRLSFIVIWRDLISISLFTCLCFVIIRLFYFLKFTTTTFLVFVLENSRKANIRIIKSHISYPTIDLDLMVLDSLIVSHNRRKVSIDGMFLYIATNGHEDDRIHRETNGIPNTSKTVQLL